MGDGRTGLIGLDWGTTSLRAYRLDRHGAVLERRSREAGILRVERGDFAGALVAAVGDWLADTPSVPVIASGMIGSRQGWLEVPYATCPAGLADLARGLDTVRGPEDRTVHIVPGLLRAAGPDGFPDVMRGEETQILGDRDAPSGRYVLPGTHSKWAWCEAGKVAGFATYMTGELFDVLRRHSILGRLMSGETPDDSSFDRGLEQARRSVGGPPGRLLHDLFSVRTLGLTDSLPAPDLASYLSGLLIGGEILAGIRDASTNEVVVLGSGALSEIYLRAMTNLGVVGVAGHADAAARGHYAIARAAGLIRGTSDA